MISSFAKRRLLLVPTVGKAASRSCPMALCRFSTHEPGKANNKDDDHWRDDRVSGYFGHNFPDFIEHWNRDNFRRVGYLLGASTGLLAAGSVATASALTAVPTVVLGALTAAYWRVGLRDMKQTSHAIRRNYPVLGNMRYIMETVRLRCALRFRMVRRACANSWCLIIHTGAPFHRFDPRSGSTW